MPDYGTVAADDLPVTTPQLAPLYPALPWELPGARFVKLAFEVDLDFVRATLPAGLARPTPPYGTLVVTDAPTSPFGPFRLAAQTLACRYRNFARAYVLQAVVDNPVALAALREVWAYPAAPGSVDLIDDPDGPVGGHPRTPGRSLRGVVSAPSGAELAVFDLTGIEGADADRIVIDGELTVRIPPSFGIEVPTEPTRLLQVNRAYALSDPTRGRFTLKFSSTGSSSSGGHYAWGAVPVTNTIIGIDTRADLEYAPTEHILDYIPAPARPATPNGWRPEDSPASNP